MNYWHLQMSRPAGRDPDGEMINPMLLLNRSPAIIGTGEWDNLQCRNFKGEGDYGLKKSDIVLVRTGKQVHALCKVVGDNFLNSELSDETELTNFREVEILKWLHDDPEGFPQPQGTLQPLINVGTSSYQYVDTRYHQYKKSRNMSNYLDVLRYKKQIVLQGPPGTGKTRTAKDVAEQIIFGSISEDKKQQKQRLEESGRFKLVQFHPSYSYEDFVRGISAKANGTVIEYLPEDKVFAEFASLANQNWKAADNPAALSREEGLRDTLDDFKEWLQGKIEEGENDRVWLTPKVYVSRVTENSIRYNSDAWNVDGGVAVSDVLLMYEADITSRKEVRQMTTLRKAAKSLSTYWLKVLELFRKFISVHNLHPEMPRERTVEKEYILVIDEINRANLSSVLGELIYALEYRGESVAGMYATNEEPAMVVPPNLLIIGTMNTADRSVGHIDYAIRRRFAFMDVLPDPEVIVDATAKALFAQVAGLFTPEYLAPDFDRKDVQLGHSYFIAENPGILKLKLRAEIIPILNEYLKDGILLDAAKEKLRLIEEFAA